MARGESLDSEVHAHFRWLACQSRRAALALLGLLQLWMLLSPLLPEPFQRITLWAIAPMLLPAFAGSYFLARVWWERECRAALADPERYRGYVRAQAMLRELAKGRRPLGADGQEVYPERRLLLKDWWVALPGFLVFVVGMQS